VKKAGWSQGRFGTFGEGKTIVPLSGTETEAISRQGRNISIYRLENKSVMQELKYSFGNEMPFYTNIYFILRLACEWTG
jgi:hypothetical protein